MRTIKLAASVCALLAAVMLTGCDNSHSKKFYSDADIPEQVIADNVTVTTEFPEYDGDVERINVTIVNDGDTEFCFGEQYSLQKLEDGEWRYIVVSGAFILLESSCNASETNDHTFDLKDHVKLPLPSGSYRIGVGFSPHPSEFSRIAYAEFSVK